MMDWPTWARIKTAEARGSRYDRREAEMRSVIEGVVEVGARIDDNALDWKTAYTIAPRQCGTTTAISKIFEPTTDIYLADNGVKCTEFTTAFMRDKPGTTSEIFCRSCDDITDIISRIYPEVLKENTASPINLPTGRVLRIFFDGYSKYSTVPLWAIPAFDEVCRRHQISAIYIVT